MEITVESLGGLGDGIATSNGKPVFIAKSCPGDTLDVTIVHENRDGMQAVINRIISPSLKRRVAPCPYFERCGGCTLQHFIPDYYREFKTRMLHGALDRAELPTDNAEVLYIADHTRRRVEFKVKHDGNAVALAFHDLRSHNPTAIELCLLLVPELEALIAPLNAALSGQDFSPFLYSVGLTLADSGIDMLLTFKGYEPSQLPSLQMLAKQCSIARISARTPEQKPVIIVDNAPVTMRLGSYDIALPVDAFLQATREGQAELTRLALAAVASSKSVVDLFCGIGSYSFPASSFAHVHGVELDANMVQTMTRHIKRHNIKNMSAQTRDLFKQPLNVQELSRFTGAIINPPRLGAKAQTLMLAESKIESVAMISCNPATFSRDASLLKNAGFTLESAQAIDQFVYSQHLEIVAIFRR